MLVQKKETQAKEVEVIISSVNHCDKCDIDIDETTDGYDAFEFELTHRTGDSYPSSGGGEKEEMELYKTVRLNPTKNKMMKGIKLLEMMGFTLVTHKMWRHEATTLHLIENDETITPTELIELIKEQGRLELKKEFRTLLGAKHDY